MESTQTPQDPQQQKTNPAAPAGATAPQNEAPPSTGTWLKLDARDPEAEAAEEAYRKESARVRRGVWIGNFVALVLVAAALAGLGYVIIPRLGRPSGAAAASVIGTEDQRMAAVDVLTKLNAQATMWKLQHNDRLPNFTQFPDWEQFVQPTDVQGRPWGANAKTVGPVCGPYSQGKPVNPVNNLSAVWATDSDVAAGSPVGAGKPVGFVFNTTTLQFYITDVAGTRVLDPAANPEAAPARPAAAPAAEPAKEPAKEPAREPAKESASEPAREPVKEAVREPVKEPVKESVKQPAKEPAKVPAKDSARPSAKATRGAAAK
jgi:hypothetical protein